MFDIVGPLTPGATTPAGEPLSLHKQLTARLQHAILSGRLPAGALLPSTRTLAAQLGVSRNTVVTAYDHLAAEGYVFADRQGTRVSSLLNPARRDAQERSAAPPVAVAARLAAFASARARVASDAPLLPGVPALDHFPLAAWRRAFERATARALPQALGYGEPLGEPALRQAIAAHLRVARGVRCDAAQIAITEGAQEALSLCATLLTNPSDTVWIEDPGYRGAKAAFAAADLRIVPIPVDHDGIAVPPDAWRTHAPTLIYTSPAHQYPTGAVLSVARRLELISRATHARAWIVEDDYDGEFRHTGEPIASMQGLVPDAPVLYVGTFSKTMFPALRTGFVVLPESVAGKTARALAQLLRGGHRLEQLALADFIASGEFARHLGRMRRLYRERQHALRDALTQHFADAQILGGNAGMHLTLRLPPHVDDRAAAERAHAHGIGVAALSAFATGAHARENGLVIGYGNTSVQQIPDAVSALVALLPNAAAGRARRRRTGHVAAG